MWEEIEGIFSYELVTLGRATVTPATLLTGVLILIIGKVFASLSSRGVERMLASRAVDPGVQFAAGKVVRYAITVIAVLVAISSVGIDVDALIAASTVLLVGLGLGLQTLASNFASGMVLLFERPVKRGDFIQIGPEYGTVTDIGLRATQVITRDEVTIIVPNSVLIGGQVINHSIPTTNKRMHVRVGVAYGVDLARARDVLLAVAPTVPLVLPDPAPEVWLETFGESRVELDLLVWIADPREDLRVGSDLRFAIHAAFREEGIAIPFPQRDLHVVSMPAPTDRSAA